MARPSKLTGEVRLTICDGVRLGVTFEEACRRAGVAPSTGWEWRARGEGRDPRRRATTRYVFFAEAVARAEEAALWRPGQAASFADVQSNGEAASRGGFAEPEVIRHEKERARVNKEPEEPSERAWLSQRSREGMSILDEDC